MIQRNPRFDFSRTTPKWAKDPDFTYTFNAMSILFPPLERFLNRVMATARTQIQGSDPRSEQIRQDIDMFIRQEGVHHAIHTAFNDMLTRNGYPDLPALEAEMEESYREMIRTEPLKFLTAYCEAFEILGPVFANVWLDDVADMFEGGDPDAVALWRWHISEEFEHRTVCFDVYNKLFGGYFYRLKVMKACRRHQGAFIMKVIEYMLSKDLEGMSQAEIDIRKQRIKTINKRIGIAALKHLWKVYIPFYSPRRATTPRNYPVMLEQIEEQYVARAA